MTWLFLSVACAPKSPLSQPTALADFSTAEATVRTFFDAAAQRDPIRLQLCFSKDAPGEFGPIVQGDISASMLDELASLVHQASIDDVRLVDRDGDGNAEGAAVSVTLPGIGRQETLAVVHEADGLWRILDF